MKNLWNFSDSAASFEFKTAPNLNSLYLPLCNDHLMSSITPSLHGDIKSGQNSFLLTPVSRIDLTVSRSSRNFWIYIDKNKIWSATGVSKDIKQLKQDKADFSAGLLWQKVTRANKKIGLSAEILSFVPSTGEPVEIMRVSLKNISSKKIQLTPTAAIPIYARSANNIRDHRHVSSLLQRIYLHKFGVISKPTLSFDEAGHKPNKENYFVLGWDEDFKAPQYLYPTQEMFCGEGGDLEAPLSVLNNLSPDESPIQGKEAIGALGFKSICLAPGAAHSYIILMGISDDTASINKIIRRFKSISKVNAALESTKKSWVKVSEKIRLSTGDDDFDRWFRWVSIQPTLRRIFGCSFLPDFDYGKGGRGWRDLWQDCLSLILNNPNEVRALLINNFSGVRIDGSNATIIGNKPGEFIADRNDIPRVWMDHGVWPLITLDLYMNETGDFEILFEETTYFRDQHIFRSQKTDKEWKPYFENKLKTASGKLYRSTILEHLLVQNLAQFFNVGKHNFVRLEGGDWNDGLDMAKDNGESVAFSAMYAYNLLRLSELLFKAGRKKIFFARELKILLKKVDYNNIQAKHKLLDEYFTRTKGTLSGAKVEVDAVSLAKDLKSKAEWLMARVRKNEWLKDDFFNGYYDDNCRRVEGKVNGLLRMSLTSQVFPIMSGAATDSQIKEILKCADRYLLDKKLNGYHLNTDFKKEQHDLGRAFSFAYGEKENGSFFNHMIVMFAFALYRRGYNLEGWRVLSSIYNMVMDSGKSRIYPCLPEYFNPEGRGMYSYLTGSASWFVLTMLTQVFGVRGEAGDLLIEPKLCAKHFGKNKTLSIERVFAGKNIKVNFVCPRKASNAKLQIKRASLNNRNLLIKEDNRVLIPRKTVIALPSDKINSIEVVLG